MLGLKFGKPELRFILPRLKFGKPELRFAIPEFRFAKPGLRFTIPEPRFAIPEFRFAKPELGFSALLFEFVKPEPRSGALLLEVAKPEFRFCVPGFGFGSLPRRPGFRPKTQVWFCPALQRRDWGSSELAGGFSPGRCGRQPGLKPPPKTPDFGSRR